MRPDRTAVAWPDSPSLEVSRTRSRHSGSNRGEAQSPGTSEQTYLNTHISCHDIHLCSGEVAGSAERKFTTSEVVAWGFSSITQCPLAGTMPPVTLLATKPISVAIPAP